jgi:regulatory protein
MCSTDISLVKNKMMAFCAYQERCRQEVWLKLDVFELSNEEKNAIIAELESEQYLNEHRFARSFAEGKFRIKKWGRIKIRMELKRRNIADTLIKESLSMIDGDQYYDVLKEMVLKKWLSVQRDESEKRKQKVMRFAYSRGYEPDMILDALNEVLKNVPE